MEKVDMNVRAPCFLLGSTTEVCGHCGSMTPVFALAVSSGHSILTADDDDDDDDDEYETGDAHKEPLDLWRTTDGNALLFHVDEIGGVAQSQLGRLAPTFRRDGHGPGRSWSNHCGHCHAVLDDHELFCEPGGAFLPMSVASGERIQFLTIDASFEGFAGGYAYEPAFIVFRV